MDSPDDGLEEIDLVPGMQVMIPILLPERGYLVRERILTVVEVQHRRVNILGCEYNVYQKILIARGVGGRIFEHDLTRPVKVMVTLGVWVERKVR